MQGFSEYRKVMKPIFDFDDCDYLLKISDKMAFDSEGNIMVRISDNMWMDMEDVDIHIVSHWNELDYDENN